MSTESKKELSKEDQEKQFQKDRREFLGKSKYAVYMTPVMLSMIVDKDAHAVSCGQSPKNPNCVP